MKALFAAPIILAALVLPGQNIPVSTGAAAPSARHTSAGLGTYLGQASPSPVASPIPTPRPTAAPIPRPVATTTAPPAGNSPKFVAPGGYSCPGAPFSFPLADGTMNWLYRDTMYDGTKDRSGLHSGIDVFPLSDTATNPLGGVGTPIYAMADGYVSGIGPDYLDIWHPTQGVETYYTYVSLSLKDFQGQSLQLKIGTQVQRGYQIGTLASEPMWGSNEWPHVHVSFGTPTYDTASYDLPYNRVYYDQSKNFGNGFWDSSTNQFVTPQLFANQVLVQHLDPSQFLGAELNFDRWLPIVAANGGDPNNPHPYWNSEPLSATVNGQSFWCSTSWQSDVPGGSWGTPPTQISGSHIQFQAQVNPVGFIGHVNFTVWWSGLASQSPEGSPWVVACSAVPSPTSGVATCDADLSQLHWVEWAGGWQRQTISAPAGATLNVSFDVYDDFYNIRNLSPNGVLSVDYGTNAPPTQGSVSVPADAGWVWTGITATAGQPLAVNATGQWSAGADSPTVGPDGDGSNSPDNFFNLTDLGACLYCATTSTPNHAALIGYIGSGPPEPGSYTSTGALTEAQGVFLIGGSSNTTTPTAPRSGMLWLAMNDDAYSGYTADNTGAVTAVVGTLTTTASMTIAVEGQDQGLWVNHGSGYVGLGGILIAAPAVVTLSSGDHLYIVTGQDHRLYIRSDALGWQPLGQSYCLDDPAAFLYGGILTVACQGSDHALWYATTPVPASGLPSVSNFTSLGGITNYGPAIAFTAVWCTPPLTCVIDTTNFFVTGKDNQIWYRSPFTGWQAISAWCTGHPAAATSGSTTYLACHSSDGALWYTTNSGSGWSGFRSLGGQLTDGPGVAATSNGPIFVMEATDRAIYWDAVSTAGVAGGWQSVGGIAQRGAAATVG